MPKRKLYAGAKLRELRPLLETGDGAALEKVFAV
mgnify:CR=1 FL=1